MDNPSATAAPGRNPLLELLVTIVLPALILMKFSAEADLGPARALLLALAFPLAWGGFDLVRRRRLNPFALLGVVSTLLTGGIGLLELDRQWLAVKEAAIPGVIGIAVIVSTRTRYPLIRTLIENPALFDVERVHRLLQARGTTAAYAARLHTATWLLGGTFFFSAGMNYLLAILIVTSPAGTAAFNAELGRLTLVSYPMIAVPSMLMMLAVLYYLARSVRDLTGLAPGELLRRAE